MSGDDPRRRIPRTDAVLADPSVAPFLPRLGGDAVKAEVAAAQGSARAGHLAPEQVIAHVSEILTERSAHPSDLRPVLNATGVVLHTNIGRAPLSPDARRALLDAAGYVDVEFDLRTGERARRGRGTLAALARAVPAAEDVLVVNNGAAALVLATTALAVAAGRPEVVVSRGEMVEIGDGFRLPELMASTGARLVEVGTTNRTQARDYAGALGPATGLVLKVHPSNFRIEGFTGAASTRDLAAVCRPAGVPLLADIGSGLLRPDPLLPDEPDAATALAAGADVVTCSGDKLLGGPQAGLALGRADLVHTLRRHPLARALRVDKLTLAALEATLRGGPTPTDLALHVDPDRLRERTIELADAVGAGEVVAVAGRVGGGGAPGLDLPGWAVALPGDLTAQLRTGATPVVARVERGATLIDLRCVPEADGPVLQEALVAVLRGDPQAPTPVDAAGA
ncbi:L-seryl-tRNA(Sec) selenium transferase [Agilicoccus flavus]|uniref:L-seryl-tRNA(Sec) selenium transferase n=1 Tax=Agilicoccus flavus TaxID=2775968 RepID=UPI001CF71A5B|nr:L-seryl-tRNA(Sec) selenium transferase [Agilicoccus flavus]